MEKESDQYFTPQWLFDDLELMFDLDVASPLNKKTYVPAKRKLTIIDDGLASNWGGLVWMNPPYSAPKLWVEKFIEHNNGIALLPLAKSKWLDSIWESDCEIYLLPSTLKFNLNRSIMSRCALFALGDESKKAIRKMGKIR